MTEPAEILRRKRLQYRSWHRGCKETDLILGRFSQDVLPGLDGAALDAFEALLDEDDAHIWDWLTGKTTAPERFAPLIETMRGLKPAG